jgi:hypothetical protein
MDDFIRNQDKKLERSQQEALKRILRLLTKTRTEVIGSILESQSEFNETSMLSTLKNIDLLMLELKDQLGSEYTNIMKEGSSKGFNDQSKLFDAMYGKRFKDVVDELVYGPVELTVLKTLEMNVDDFLYKFTGGLREKIKSTIQLGFIHGRSEGETVQAIKQQFDTQLAPTKRAVHHIYQTAYNVANHEVLLGLEKNVPGLKKEWYSTLDKVTTPPCIHLHEQVKLVQEPFVEPQSLSKFMYPPAVYGNPNMKPIFHFCRSRAIPYLESNV